MGTFTEVVVPVFGNLLGCIMLLSPVPAVLGLRKSGKLGDINPLPYPMTAINCIGWVVYGYALPNPAILPANVLGFVAGVFFTLVAYGCAPQKVQDRIAAIFVFASGYFVILGIVSTWGLSHSQAARMWGTSAVVILMLYYYMPLSTMVTIVRTRNAASIYPPLAFAAIANCTLWTVYGLAVQDINLWLPNMFGTVIGVVQVGLRYRYPPPKTAADGTVTGPGGRQAMADVEAAFRRAQVGDADGQLAVEGRMNSASQLLAVPVPGTSPGLGSAGVGYAAAGLGPGAGADGAAANAKSGSGSGGSGAAADGVAGLAPERPPPGASA